MKWRFSYLIIILIALGIGYVLEPMLYPNAKLVERKKKAEDDRYVYVEVTKTKQKPKPVAAVEPEEIIDDGGEDLPDDEEGEEETDMEGADIKKMKRMIGEDSGRRPVQEERFIGKNISNNEWRNPKKVERKLASRLRSMLGDIKQEKILALLQKPENRLMIAQWEVLHKANLDELSALMKDRTVADSLAPLLDDLQWVTSFAYDGQLEKPEVALAMIYHFRKVDPQMDNDVLIEGTKVRPGVKRRIASAVAVQFTRNGWYGAGRELTKEEIKHFKDTGIPLPDVSGEGSRRKGSASGGTKDNFHLARERYLFFSKSWDEGLLNTYFGTLPDWLMHIVCGWKGNNRFGTASTMRWLRDNTSTSAMKFTGMAFQVPYIPLNKYGATIFTPQYYEPFEPLYPGNFAKMTRDIGAVCGGLSHYGTAAACSNGVPAVTMGEPGHCAYAVYADGKWNPTNTISEKRSPHWNCWGLYSWSAFQMMTDMYQDGQRTRDAQMVTTLASLLAANKNPTKSLKLYEMGVTMQPLYKPVWIGYLETAAKFLSKRPSKYLGVNDFICTSVAPSHPEMCANYLTELIYPTLLRTLKTSRQKMVAFQSYFGNLNVNEKAEWDMEKLLDMQFESLGKGNPPKEAYFKLIAESVRRRPEFGIALSWAVRKAYIENKSLGDRVRGMVDKLLKELPPEDSDQAPETSIRRLLNASVVRAAEEMGSVLLSGARTSNRDRDYYIKLANQYCAEYMKDENAKPMPSFTPPPGRLISPGGMVMLDGYAPQQDSIVKHAAALTPEGGHILSEKGKHRKLIIELPKKTNIGGVVIVPNGRNCSHYREWNIETSTDGKEWTLLTKLPDSSEKPCLTININHNSPTAKFIRIDSGAEQGQGIDFRAVLVYDNKKGK